MRRTVLALLVAAAGACAGPGEPTSTIPTSPPAPLTGASPFLISNAVSGSAAAVLGSPASSLIDERVYLSAPPGTFPGIASASVRVDRTGATTAAALIDGGLDPISVPARMGDTLTVMLFGAAGSSTTYRMTVPGRKPPIIVRTVPLPNKRDVPLNARMVVVFSEPIDALSLTAQSISVRAGSVIVPGTLAFTTPDQTTAEFVPSGDLQGSTNYELVITENITDRDGSTLDAPLRVPFTTVAESADISITGMQYSYTAGEKVAIAAKAIRQDDLRPIANLPITFVSSAGGTVDPTIGITDSNGVATTTWTVPVTTGLGNLRASNGTAIFEATADIGAAAAARINKLAGDAQQAIEGELVDVRVAVTDAFGNAIAGRAVAFVVTDGGGSVTLSSATTAADGSASTRWIVGVSTSPNTLEARTLGVPSATFTAVARRSLTACVLPNCPTGRLAFVRDGDIYSAFADGSNPIRLTRGTEPAWSADGRIAFTETTNVFVMNEDGTNVRLVAQGATSPAWSPDAQRLAVVTSILRGYPTIAVVTVDGTTAPPVRVGFDTGLNAWPTWSPDGSRIAFVSDAIAYDFAMEVFVVDRQGQRVDQLTRGFTGESNYLMYAQPAWSPTGAKMALLQCPSGQFTPCTESYLVVASTDLAMNTEGKGTVKLRATQGYVRPSWSPDGKWITFDDPSGIRYISVDGGQHGILIPNASSATWRP